MMTAETKKPASPFAIASPAIVAHGYTPLPLLPRDKAPGEFVSGRWRLMAGWNRLRDRKPESFAFRLWAGYEGANIGIVLGTPAGAGQEVIAIDFDTDDAATMDMLLSALPPSPVRKRGARGHTAFYRAPAGTPGRRFKNSTGMICEILTGNAPRQTVIPPSIHPNGAAYVWMGPDTLENTRPDQLPALLEDQLERFYDTLEHICPPSPEQTERPAHDASDETIWGALNSAALARLNDWVPVLNLPKLKSKGGRWEAVAHWRPSSTGRATDQRKPNLSIHRDGIKDFGTDQTYSPLDLLMASQGWPLDTAFLWLSERLGMFSDTWEGGAEPPEPEPPAPAAQPKMAPPSAAIPDDVTANLPGLLGDVTKWLLETARRPNRVLAMGAAVGVIGTLCGRRVAGPTLSGTHLYVIGLAGSGAGKDHPVKKIAPLLESANAGHLVGAGKFMSETALINMATRKPLCLCPMDEFGAFLAKINHRRASSHEMGISAFLREAWGRSFDTMITPEWGGRESERIEAPAMSIFGVSTPDEFFASLTGADVINGFLNRFLMLDGDLKVADADPSSDPLSVPKGLARDLAHFYHQMNVIKSTENLTIGAPVRPSLVMSWGPGARDLWTDMKLEVEPLSDDYEHGSFYRRTVEIALRLATVRAVGQGLAEVDAASMAWGRLVAEQSAHAMKLAADEHMAVNDRAALRNRILRFVRRKGEPVNRRDVHRFIKSEVDSRTLADVLGQMVEAGDLKCQPAPKPEIGRPPVSPLYMA